MLVVGFIAIIIFFLFAMFGTASIGFAGWYFLLQSGEKQHGEILLYITIIFICILFLLCLKIILRSHKRVHSIEKMIDLARINGIVDEDRFDTFGKLGSELKILYNEIIAISEKRAQRLFFMDSMADVLFDVISEKIIAVDIQGNILYAGQKAIPKKETFPLSEKGLAITELIPSLDFTEAASKASREHATITVPLHAGASMICIPIFGSDNSANGFLLSLDNLESAGFAVEHFLEKIRSEKKKTTEKRDLGKKRFFHR